MKCSQCGYSTDPKQRSNNQNRYYYGVCIRLLCEHTGYTPEEVHEVLKHKFLRKTLWIQHNHEGVKEMTEITRSTISLKTKEFEEYLTSIRQWASLCLGVNIPEPNENIIQAYQ